MPDNATLLARSMERAHELIATDPEIARLAPMPDVLEELQRQGSTVEVLALACRRYADRPALGSRVGGKPRFETITYAEVWRRTEALASGLQAAGLAQPGSLVGICGYGSPEFVLADLACLYLGAVSVPLQTTLAANDLAKIVEDAEIGCLFASKGQLALAAGVAGVCPSVRGLVAMDLAPDVPADGALLDRERDVLEGRGMQVWTIPALEALADDSRTVPMAVPAKGSNPLVTLLYTSGSTGLPKGAMYPDSHWREAWLRSTRNGPVPPVPHLTVSYLPMNHLMGRLAVVGTLARGGLVQFTLAPDMSTLFEDVRLARPTVLALVPRVAELIHQQYQLELVRRGEPAERIMAELGRTLLGDRLLTATIGSAPTAPEVLAFLRRCFQVPILEGYGSTEAGVITYENRVVPGAVTAFKVIDAPEAGYLLSDQPFPRGQLLVKTRWAVPGYFRSPEATRALYDEEGYLRTGDIVEDRGDGELVWVGRAKDVIKLSQGEFVTLWRIESALAAGGPLVRQVYLSGSSERAYLVGVIVPDAEAIRARLGHEGTPDEVQRLLQAEIDRIAALEGLRPWEVPRAFLVEESPFSKENGLLTESGKVARPRLKQRYGERLGQLYQELDRAQVVELAALRHEADAPVERRVATAVRAVLSLRELDPSRRFTDLGGDSLAAVQLATLLEELCGVRVPEGQILDPGMTIAGLARAVEQARHEQDAGRPTFEAIHGAGATTVRAEDLRLDKFLGAEELETAPYQAPPGGPRACLLTGAGGFLGRFLVLELLERLPDPGGRLYCVVRAPDDAAATRRLRAAFEQADPALRERFDRLAGDRLEVLAGDLMKPRLGLTEATFQRLAEELDLILHNGALVNHAFTYAQLFEPNVVGTAEVLRLALRHHPKAVAYVSTVGVVAGVVSDRPVAEAVRLTERWNERPVGPGYAVGYATSKWAGEVLADDYQARTGAPVTVFRPTMILTPQHSQEINATDRFVRLLTGLVTTGVAPATFYAPGGRPTYDGLPADFIARAIVAIAFAAEPAWRIFHVAKGEGNPDMDAVVGWVRSAGYPLERLDGYDQWFQTFEARLRAQDERHQQQGPLAIVRAWAHPERLGRQPRLANGEFRARVRDLLGVERLPELDEAQVHKTLAAMASRGLIPSRPGAIIWAPPEPGRAPGPP
jgi:fatty acid CoA ligase FadD9